MKVRDSILAQIKKDLRGKKNTWHMVEFNYFGYNVRAKMHGVHAQRIECKYPQRLTGGQDTITDSMPYSVTTIKAAVEYFGEFLDFLDISLYNRYKAGRMNQQEQLEYILNFDPLGVLS